MSAADWLTLILTPGFTRARSSELFARYGDASTICAASRTALKQAGLSDESVSAIKSPDQAQLKLGLSWLEKPQHHLVHWQDPRYPAMLRETGQGPMCLFVAGDPDVLSLPQIAIVGSRNATPGGIETARNFAAHLARTGFVITSGLALGIDAAAHDGALHAGGLSIAVEGTGLDQVYPSDNQLLAKQISTHGARVSEFAPGAPARREQFPQRNRIIAGLALGTLVVEAGARSGALITARHSGDYGREVFAIPGSIHSPLSKGCHRLIRQGAKLVESAGDIVEELAPLLSAFTPAANAETPVAEPSDISQSTDPEYAKLLDTLGFDPMSIDGLVSRSGLTAENLSSMLLILELQGAVKSVPGGRFQRMTKWKLPNE